jgi:two-component system OmpR family sensor kinase
MSSSLRTERRRRGPRWLLRTRLIAGLVVLLTLVSLFTVAVTELAVRTFLTNQLDAQVAEASGRARAFADPNLGDRDPPPDREGEKRDPLQAPGQAAGTLNAHLIDGQFEDAGRLSSDGDTEPIPAAQREVLAELPTDGRPHTRDLGELGDYRLTAFTTPEGDVIITGLPLAPVNRTLLNIGLILGAIALVGLLAAVAVGTWIVRRTLAPLDRVAATAGRVAELPMDSGHIAIAERVPEADTDPRTEVGQVGLGLNRLLDSVEDALVARHHTETRVRQFVADASHELRTPLAAVRGYAELVRRSGGTLDPDVAHAISRVESEAARMTTLVEDLLLLARLDSGRPLDDEPVDLSRLVVDVVSDARVAGADHVWRLELPDSPVEVRGDEARLHQVLANLLTNARTHTPPDTVVTVALASSDGNVELTVADDGPGIPPDVLPDVFERFARGDTSRSRAAGSTGLGLAIVEAVVHAHHGDVTAASEPGRTTFTVHLPRA